MILPKYYAYPKYYDNWYYGRLSTMTTGKLGEALVCRKSSDLCKFVRGTKSESYVQKIQTCKLKSESKSESYVKSQNVHTIKGTYLYICTSKLGELLGNIM